MNGTNVSTRATMPCGSLINSPIVMSGSAAVSDQIIASCCASRMFEPSDPVPSIRLPKNRNASMKSGSASPSAAHGMSSRDVNSIGTMPTIPTRTIENHTAICISPAPPRPINFPARISSGFADESKTSTTLFSFSIAVPCIRYPDVMRIDIRKSTMKAIGTTRRTMVAILPPSLTAPARVTANARVVCIGMSTRAAVWPSTRPFNSCPRMSVPSSPRASDMETFTVSGSYTSMRPEAR